MALRAEPIERAAHIEVLLCVHVEECQVNGAATCVAAPLVDILLLKEHALVEPCFYPFGNTLLIAIEEILS